MKTTKISKGRKALKLTTQTIRKLTVRTDLRAGAGGRGATAIAVQCL